MHGFVREIQHCCLQNCSCHRLLEDVEHDLDGVLVVYNTR